jgi:hypothetical protein
VSGVLFEEEIVEGVVTSTSCAGNVSDVIVDKITFCGSVASEGVITGLVIEGIFVCREIFCNIDEYEIVVGNELARKVEEPSEICEEGEERITTYGTVPNKPHELTPPQILNTEAVGKEAQRKFF